MCHPLRCPTHMFACSQAVLASSGVQSSGQHHAAVPGGIGAEPPVAAAESVSAPIGVNGLLSAIPSFLWPQANLVRSYMQFGHTAFRVINGLVDPAALPRKYQHKLRSSILSVGWVDRKTPQRVYHSGDRFLAALPVLSPRP